MPEPILDLGCGSNKLPQALGLDLARRPGVDVVADVSQGLPFAPGSFAQVRLRHLVEHVTDLVGLMAEVHRVCRPGAQVYILTPHFSAAASYHDPTHQHHFSLNSFDYFCGLAAEDFTPLSYGFAMIHKRLIFGRKGRLGLDAWANRHPGLYEQHLAFLLPALEIEVILRAIK
ncbi:MAG: methyltransferase domain-containing protein [Desulfarculaceae bacterium]|jgi:SAM-dependent methyltransferase